MIRQRFEVRFDYPVYFTAGLFDPGNPVLAEVLQPGASPAASRFVVFIDDGLAAARPALIDEVAYYARMRALERVLAAPPELVPGGEAAKNQPHLVERFRHRLCELGIDRHSFAVAVGGGAMLDLMGYVAATTHRGIRLVRVPTTVLAQNDAGIGVKNGVNAFGVKNFVGTFAPPFAVLNDIDFIDSLEHRDRIAGMAEAVKVALIRDGAFFAWLEQNTAALAAFERPAMAHMIRRCAELHLAQIARGGDPFEAGNARPLDYGHWAAHKLESLTDHALRHGEAVAVGMALDARYAVQIGMLAAGEELRICALLERLGFRLWHPAIRRADGDGTPALLIGLREFQEHLGGELAITLLAQVGTGIEVHEMDQAQILRAIDWLIERDRSR